ncbi:MAG: ribosome maturation factor RimM [Sediminibacterium sp.]|nr:ribosome maturation factor RimM [Sediminibacterium sp.]
MKLREVGYFSKTHGLKGWLVFKPSADFDVEQVNALFLKTTSGEAPYFIENIKETGNNLAFLLETIDTVEKARTLINKPVLIDEKFIIESEEEDFNGYKIEFSRLDISGTIQGIIDMPGNSLFDVAIKGKQVLLPYTDDFIVEIDNKKKRIEYNAPEGLLDVYLNE